MNKKHDKKEVDDNKKLLQIAEENKINPKQLEAIIETTKYRNATPTIDLSEHVKDGKVTFGVLSDTRINSIWMRPDIFRSLYKKFKEEGVSYVFHCGDFTDGYMRYKMHTDHQIYQVHKLMLEKLLDDNSPEGYPDIGVKTYFIGGNLDKTFSKSKDWYGNQVNVCEDISRIRKDLVFAGWNSANIKIAPKTTVRLSHPLPGIGSRKPYAISYPIQRKVHAFGAGQKPAILLSGYFQKRFEFKIRGIEANMIGSCISQTPVDAERDISAPSLGGVIFEVYFKKDGSMEKDGIITTDIPFYD